MFSKVQPVRLRHLDFPKSRSSEHIRKSVSRPGYLEVLIDVSGLMDFDVEIDIPVDFSVYNSLTAIAVCRHFDVPTVNDQTGFENCKGKGKNRRW